MKILRNLLLLLIAIVGLAACAPGNQQAVHSHPTATENDPERITVKQVLARLDRGEQVVFIDTRNDVDWGLADSKIPGAIRVGTNEQLVQRLAELSKDLFIVPYCT